MCGQVGFVLGSKRRSTEEWQDIVESFLYLMIYSEAQGPHATGLAVIQKNGSYRLYKRPGRAHRHINTESFLKNLLPLDSETTLLMGHTRYRTRGSEKQNRNNHPLRAGLIIGTHNGTIYNADELFTRFGLPRQTEVDSEFLVRMADRHTNEGIIDREAFLRGVALAEGLISAVLTSIDDPERVIILKGNKPLTLWVNPRRKLVAYASQERWLEQALDGQKGWKKMDLPDMSVITLHRSKLTKPEIQPFHFRAQ